MGNLGAWEIALIVLAILLVFGPKRLPGIGRSLGKGMREFKDSVGDTAKELKEATADTPVAFGDGLNPKKQFKDALNPFAEEKVADEVVKGEIVAAPEASAAPVGSSAPEAEVEPEPAREEESAAATSERT
jgi:sec-independent protein translocase protein TatA